MDTINDIRQLQATIKALELLVRCGRAKQIELDKAKIRLGSLRAFEQLAPPATSVAVMQNSPLKHSEKNLPVLTDLLQQIRRMRHEQATLSNQLHEVDENESAIELTTAIIEKGQAIEKTWTSYRYVEKNGVLPVEPTPLPIAKKPEELLRLEDERKRYGEERSKLKSKLKTPGQSENMREKWTARLYVLNGILEGLDEKIRIEKNR